MPKAEPGTAAHLNNQIRKSQKTKIRWYCGLCQVACKDENGYKCHLEHETHIHRSQAVQESLRTFKPKRSDIDFRRKFLDYLVQKHFGQTVHAHEVYRELYPLDRSQNLIKQTCWETLGVFVAQLRKEGRVEAHKGLRGWAMRITSDDFSDGEPDEMEKGDKKEGRGEKRQRKVREENSEPVVMESHAESTARTSTDTVVFSFTKPAAASSAEPTGGIEPSVISAFGGDSSDEEE